jgi:phthalate 4,5-dioxygenase oxygenase subunit
MLGLAMNADAEPPARGYRNSDLFTFEGMVRHGNDWRLAQPPEPVMP